MIRKVVEIEKKVQSLWREDFEFFRQAIRERAGIVLSDAKQDLLRSRLRSRLLELGLDSLADYRRMLSRLAAGDPEWQIFINLLTTNKTDWFREPEHFAYLIESYIPRWIKAKKRAPLSIWCAASSTGEEPYSLAMLLDSHFGEELSFQIIASDIDTKVLAYGRNGVYGKQQVMAHVPSYLLASGFVSGTQELAAWVKVRRTIKEKVKFCQLNLLDFPYGFEQKFDLILCRNVFIYFSQASIVQVVNAQFECVKPSGLLMIGHSESIQAQGVKWKYVKPSIYVKGELP